MSSIRKIRNSSLVSMIISSIVILSLLTSASKAFAADLRIDAPTQFLSQGTLAPFSGYLVNPFRFEKTIIAIADLQSTKENSELKSRLLAIAEQERDLAQQRLDVQKQVAAVVEKGLQKKIASLDVWYKKPWFVATSVAVIFIATGVFLP